ncbi:hypothetical protein V5P93_000799 [Actinokineospora auranticolor]|uniref:Type VII secretion system (Wss) protein ESAT-6 n=1 Tax=Actinokineospora auranticolor TaxID=155976 RepID=A0A2S6GYJ1_9PSEU|nr:hypothetical protein [Actinokineospora auranticolor]PPK70322.1 hypothetical protein CLV40_102234 [Actinokineospora auranticolor]
MSIQDQAQQLAGLADRLPTGGIQQLNNELQQIGQQVSSLLGQTQSANAVHSILSQAQNVANDLGQLLEQARTEITNAAHHHLSAG